LEEEYPDGNIGGRWSLFFTFLLVFYIFAQMKRKACILLFLLVTIGLHAQEKQAPRKKILKQWTLSSDFTEEVNLPFDTLFSLFHRYRITDSYSALNATLGNYGLPFYQINFFDRITDPDRFLYSSYYPFMHIPGKNVFMNTQVPFSELVWTFGAPRETSEQTFRVRHSQNVNRFLNIGLIYDVVYSLGQYNYQRSEDKTFTLYSSYTGPKYKLYASMGLNNIVSYENGGITGTDQLELFDTRDVPTRLGGLSKAKSSLKNHNLLLVQRYTIGGTSLESDTSDQKKKGFLGLSGTFSHILILENNKRTYEDGFPGSGFYDTIFISSSNTFDSLYAGSIKNTLRFDFTTDETRKFRLGGGFGIRNELFRYGQIVPTHDTLFSDTATWNRHNNVLVGRLYNNVGDKFRWSANGELFITGFRAGDFNLYGDITKSFDWKKGMAAWSITGGVINMQPSFWYNQWGGNHFEWHNDMSKEFRANLGTRFSYPGRRTDIRFNYAIIDNYTDFDTDALPSQHTGGLSVAALSASKEVSLWKFHLAADILVQKSSNQDVLDLPFFTVRSTAFFEHLFRFKQTNGKLNTQLGAEVIYHTSYYPYSYMPATGRFYRQTTTSTGDYPFINVFLNIKLQRTRIFIMFDHVNSGLMGYEYFMTPSYPLNIRMFRYGFAWTFYN
jgi:hypothetical protein